jgi:hypothetical protein
VRLAGEGRLEVLYQGAHSANKIVSTSVSTTTPALSVLFCELIERRRDFRKKNRLEAVGRLRFLIHNNKQKNFCIGYYTHHSFSVTLFILGSRLFYSAVIKSSEDRLAEQT